MLRYVLTRRYGAKDSPAAAAVPEDSPEAAGAAPGESSVSFLAAEEREEFCEAHQLGRYRGGETLPPGLDKGVLQNNANAGDDNPHSSALAESLLRLAFVCVSLGEEDYLLPLLEEAAR